MLQTFYTEAAPGWYMHTLQLVTLLASSAPQLRRLELSFHGRTDSNPQLALPEGLGQLGQLTSLTLGVGDFPVTAAQVDAVVRTLPLLQHLVINSSEGYQALGFPISIATTCSQLQHLEIARGTVGHVPPELGRLTALTRLQFRHAEVRSLPDSISNLCDLQELDLVQTAVSMRLPSGLTGCGQLTQLVLHSVCESPVSVLGRLHALRSLSVGSLQWYYTAQEKPWTQLTALTELDLHQSNSIPDGLGGMSGLRKLSIRSAVMPITDLPAGPYLSCLEVLELPECTFEPEVPAVLAAAKRLRHLGLGSSRQAATELTDAEIALFSALPVLSTIRMWKPSKVAARVWSLRLAKLQAACIAQGHAPPAFNS